MSLRTQSIHSPDRGSLSRLPEKRARINRGNPNPRLSVKKTRKPSQGEPMEATQVKSPSTNGPIQGAATTPRVRPINRLPK